MSIKNPSGEKPNVASSFISTTQYIFIEHSIAIVE